MKFPKANKGFTLIELIVVIAIIGILSSVVLASISTARERARDGARKAMIKQVMNALELYAVDYGNYPVVTAPFVFNNIDLSLSVLAPNYIRSLDYDTNNAAAGAHYYRPTNSSDGYQIWYAQERQTQTTPISYMCRTGMGTMADDNTYYPNTPTCSQ
jgi:prepilin-type N-terminal cleavage/methylation domain-containing protein